MRTACRALLMIILAAGMRPVAAAEAPPQSPAQSAQFGAPVRWEGEIVRSMRDGEDTCFDLRGPLDEWGFYVGGVAATQEFLACAFGYYDPALFAPGRRLLVEGSLNTEATHLIGGQAYRLPLVGAATLSLLPELPRYYPPPYEWPSPFYDPYWSAPPYPYPRWRHH